MRVASAIVAGLLLAALAAGAYLRKDHEGVEYALGAAFGTLVFGLAFGWILRFPYVKVRKRGRVASHWLLWIAVAGTLVAAAGNSRRDEDRLANQVEEVRETQEREAKRCGEGARFQFPRIEGATTREPTDEELAGGALYKRAGVEMTLVEEDGVVIAFVARGTVTAEHAGGFMRAANDAVRSQGGRDSGTTTLDGAEVRRFEMPDQQWVMTFHRGCHGFTVRGGDRATARFVSEAILRSL